MQLSKLPPDDRVTVLTPIDRSLLLKLEEAASDHFYLGCDRIIQSLLTHCQWVLTTNLKVPTLTLACPDAETYWTVISHIESIGGHLQRIAASSRIEVIPRGKANVYYEIKAEA